MDDEAQKALDEKIEALLDRIVADNSQHGGLLARETIRAADELRRAVAAATNKRKRGSQAKDK